MPNFVRALPSVPEGDTAFTAPWEIRAFAMAVAAYDASQFEWSEFQRPLIESIRAREERSGSSVESRWSYYEHWLAALETHLASSGAFSGADLDQRTRTALATRPDRDHHKAHLEPVRIDPARTP
ncbi:nitrile hydratase accessory protein [Rhodococcus qingshengii]|uniref:nitrile hydratase accessory protein n=1 Tax=Rhodococcus qingshengii TaxID=334542 RepID=UPI00279BF311|nr:nitrile hydratase accessory protein [Rhodococcus qingshengii]